MILPIYTYNDTILRAQTSNINKNDDITTLVTNMFDTMHNAGGCGLAAPQIGVSKNVVIIEVPINAEEIFKGVFLNPVIVNYSGYFSTFTEGCLSFPKIGIEIIRPLNIEVEWYDTDWNYHKEVFTGMKSRILQHEIDHLNGILFIDRVHIDSTK